MPHTTGQAVAFDLPWPNRKLSPNGRSHWGAKSRATKAARTDAAWAVRAVLRVPPRWPAVLLTMEFCPPDNRRRDRDNLIASMKAATDGIADALGTDDSKFTTTYALGAPVKGGLVRVTVRQA